jgi:hypothetical protein
MTVPRPVSTPVGASAVAGSVVTIAMYLLSLWHAWSQVPGDVKAAVQAILTFAGIYGAGYVCVVRSPGQMVSLELTPGALPTVQNVAEPPAL